MNISFYNGRSGALAYEKSMEVISNNMANINTVGFTPSRMSFSDALYQNINGGQGNGQVRRGHGVKTQQVDLLFQQGVLQNTNRNLDFAILGDGFFGLQTAEGDIVYSRAGNFQLSNQYGEFYLADPQGNLVLDQYEQPIWVDTEDGQEFNLDELEIGVFTFPNQYGLVPIGNNHFVPSVNSGTSEYVEQPQLKQGYLEASAVDASWEMAKVIEHQRAFQFNTRMIQLADELEQTINNMR